MELLTGTFFFAPMIFFPGSSTNSLLRKLKLEHQMTIMNTLDSTFFIKKREERMISPGTGVESSVGLLWYISLDLPSSILE